MSFDSTLFVWFLIIVFLGYWLLMRRTRSKVMWLLGASYFFYAAWNAELLALIVFSTVVDFGLGRLIHDARSDRVRKMGLAASICTNLGVLGYFKYTNFFLRTAEEVSEWMRLGVDFPVLEIVLPVGISFYTFQTMSYTIDIYREEIEPIDDFAKFALFVSFFPQLVAGPIVRAKEFLPQLERLSGYDVRQHGVGLWLIVVGMVKKIAIADYLAINLVDRAFDNPALYSSLEMVMAVYAYAIQIYCDFSGYSDIAIGTALLLGFQLPENFRRPYAARNLREFWHRWHISLSTWLRDYLYISLGGSRHGTWKTYRNLMITMVLGGLWHGASWNFVIWGTLHGGALAVNRAFQRQFGHLSVFEQPSRALRAFWVAATFHFVCFAWIFFRAPSFERAEAVLARIGEGSITAPNLSWVLTVMIGGMIALHMTPIAWEEKLRERFVHAHVLVKAILLCLAAILLQQMKGMEVVPFIYFQF